MGGISISLFKLSHCTHTLHFAIHKAGHADLANEGRAHVRQPVYYCFLPCRSLITVEGGFPKCVLYWIDCSHSINPLPVTSRDTYFISRISQQKKKIRNHYKFDSFGYHYRTRCGQRHRVGDALELHHHTILHFPSSVCPTCAHHLIKLQYMVAVVVSASATEFTTLLRAVNSLLPISDQVNSVCLICKQFSSQ